MIRSVYSSADRNWSLASMRGRARRAVEAALRLVDVGVGDRRAQVSSLRPYAASAFGLAWMRTAGRWPPAMLTSPTPGSWEIFCASRVSARSWICGSGIVRDVSASVTIGVSAGLTLL